MVDIVRYSALFYIICYTSHSSIDGQFIKRLARSVYSCGEDLSAGSGYLESPGYPNMYPSDVQCRWVITAPPRRTISIKSERFEVESSLGGCFWDYLEIYDRSENNIIGKFCGNSSINLNSSSNMLILRFKSDASMEFFGFRLMYQSSQPETADPSCVQSFESSVGYFTSPNYPHPYDGGANCTYTIIAPVRKKIEVTFAEMNLEIDYQCRYDYLVAFDGADSGGPELGRYCQGNQHVVRSSGNHLHFLFVSDNVLHRSGFNATYRFFSVTENLTLPPERNYSLVHPDCSGLRADDNGRVSSPEYPSNYTNNKQCVTIIRAPAGHAIRIVFDSFLLEDGENCNYDSLQIKTGLHEGSSSMGKFCGTMISSGRQFVTPGNIARVEFVSDHSVTASGFLLTYSFIAPGGAGCTKTCLNGGTCVLSFNAEQMCSCRHGYNGSVCEVSMDACASSPCRNGGSCLLHESRPFCQCPRHYLGINCDIDGSGAEQDVFSHKPQNASVSVGRLVILECAVHGQQVDVLWMFNGRVLDAADHSLGIRVREGGVLQILQFQAVHEGRYDCIAPLNERLYETSAWLTVDVPCHIELTRAPQNQTVVEGNPALLQCYSRDDAEVTWLKDGDPVIFNNRVQKRVNGLLTIQQTTIEDAGKYTCMLMNDNSCSSRASAWLQLTRNENIDQICGKPVLNQPGNSPLIPSSRIVSGYEAQPGSAPWFVMLITTRRPRSNFCGGSLVNSHWMVTAAHCVQQFSDQFHVEFNANSVDLILGTETCMGTGGVRRKPNTVVVHPRYTEATYDNDIALIRFHDPVQFSDRIIPICMEQASFVEHTLFKSGEIGIVSGCGQLSYGYPTPEFLNEVKVPYRTRGVCRNSTTLPFTPNMFCAGFSRRMRGDACLGDSGGPYIMKHAGRWVLSGLVSWGEGCDQENKYGFYTHVSSYYGWIQDTMTQFAQ